MLTIFQDVLMDPWFLFQLWFSNFFQLLDYQTLTVLMGGLITLMVAYGSGSLYKKFRYKNISEKCVKQPRFRKRDKMLFYGRKMLRKVKMFGGSVPEKHHRIKKRQMVVRLAKRLLRMKLEQPLTLQVMEPSQAFLEEAIPDSSILNLPSEVVYMLKSIRVFGFFERPLFIELCKYVETSQIPSGSLLFSIGEPDDSIYIVQYGKIIVYVTDPLDNNSEHVLKSVEAGESITSLLSVMDVLTGHIAPYKTVSAKAVEDSCVLRLKVEAFKSILEKNPESLVRVAQIVMVRLQRITFMALHQYLGLANQLIKSSNIRIASEGQESLKPRKRKPSYYVAAPHDIVKCTLEDFRLQAVKGFAYHLSIEDDSLLNEYVMIQEFEADSVLLTEENVSDVALFYVLNGSLSVSQKSIDTQKDKLLFVVHIGELTGALSVLSGEPSLFTVRARHFSRIGVLTKEHTYEVLRKSPIAVLNLAQSVIRRLSPFVRQIDFALDWINVESGEAIYRQGDKSDCTYILLSGRLRSVLTRINGKKELVGEYGRGDLIGIVEALICTERSTTVMAVRNSELAKLPEGLLNWIKIKFPEVLTRLIHLLGTRLLGTLQKNLLPATSNIATLCTEEVLTKDSRPSGSNFATIAILPTTDAVPLFAFTMELYYNLSVIGPTLRLTSDVIKKMMGPTALSSHNEYRLCGWLGQQEDHHKIVLYQCDPHFSVWTQRCMRQADCIIILALADEEPCVGKLEKHLDNLAVRTQKEFVLLHRDDGIKPRNTVQWLNMRSWCSYHHHIRCPKRMFAKKSQIKMMEMYNKIFQHPPSKHTDFARLARFLTGTSIGLVLGGGGARGAAHVGIIRALYEAGIPIDMIGGVSIGAFMGALWCQENNLTTFTQKAREWSFKMNSYWRQILDLTYPATAMFTGAAFNRTIHEVFGERQIEDLWLPYFTVTTDISASSMRVHTHGSLWRYIRSSMSLSGYMPPMCDPLDGHLLLDGGYVNNLPADVMKDMGAQMIIAIDVGSQDDTDLTNYGDTLNGWSLLWNRWNPWANPMKVPSLQEIQSRLAYVSCVKQLEQLKRSDYCTYVRPPIDKYRTLQFGCFDEIMEQGYSYGKVIFDNLNIGHKKSADESVQKIVPHYIAPASSPSFIDLAETVCKLYKPHTMHTYTESESEEEEDYYTNIRGVSGYSSEPDPSFLGDTDKEDDGEDFSPSQRRDNIGSLSDIEISADREL